MVLTNTTPITPTTPPHYPSKILVFGPFCAPNQQHPYGIYGGRKNRGMCMDKPDNVSPIPGYRGYFITKTGNVWSGKSKGRWIKQHISPEGYRTVALIRNSGHQKTCRVHRLVLETFVSRCPEYMEACHNNGDPSDNRLENLRWDTRSANCIDAVKHGTAPGLVYKGENHGQAKLTGEDVRLIYDAYHDGGYDTREIARQFDITYTHVWNIAHRRTWRHLWSN
jgi:hypothetical protein